MQLAMQQLC
nr:unnamed protein product [Callosobruchus chinensis]